MSCANQNSRKPNSEWRSRNSRNPHNSNNNSRPNATSFSVGSTYRRNGRQAPSSPSRPVAPEQAVQHDDNAHLWGEPDPTYWEKKERKEEARRREQWLINGGHPPRKGKRSGPHGGHAGLPPERRNATRGSAHRFRPEAESFVPQCNLIARCAAIEFDSDHIGALSLNDDDGTSSKDSGVGEMGGAFRDGGRRSRHTRNVEKKKKLDEKTEETILKVYQNDLLMENIISHVTKLSDRSQIEMASSRMFVLSKRAPYRFSEGGDHLHIHFTTFDDFATIQYGSVVRTVPILTLNTRRFDKMESKMTSALHRILKNIESRFARNVRKITLGGTTDFYSARGVPDHHLILTYDFLLYLLQSFPCFTSLHLINCGIDDGALDICDSSLWISAMARMESIVLRTVWADTASKLPELLKAPAFNLQHFMLTRFTCKRMGAALLAQLRASKCRLKEAQLVLDEDSAGDHVEMLCLLKEVACRTDSLRITVAEVGDGSQLSPKCFSILPRMRDLANLTELKFYVQPKNAGQFDAVVELLRDLEMLPSLRTLHLEGFVDGSWLSVDAIYNLADAFRTGMPHLRETLGDLSLSNFPRPTKYNAHGYKGDRKEGAFNCLWDSIASSISMRRLRKLALTSMRLDDAHLLKIYEAINKTAEEVYLRNIRGVTSRSVQPLVNGGFLGLRKLEAEIAVEPLVLHNLSDVAKTPLLLYAKFALKWRITNDDHHTKMLRTMFTTVFLDQDSPRGPLKQFIEVRGRIPGAQPPPAPEEPEHPLPSRRPHHQAGRALGDFVRHHRTRPKNLYGDWDD